MTREFTVAIIGGGIVGSCTALALVSDPRFRGRVLVFERDPSYARAATTLSAASIRQQFTTPVNVRMSQYGVEFLREARTRLAVDGEPPPDIGLVESTYLYLATTGGAATMRDAAATQAALGVAVELADPDALRARYPWLDPHGIALAAWTRRGEGWFDATSLLHAVRRKAIALGARYVRADVERIAARNARVQRVVATDGAELAADACVCAAGTRTPALLARLGCELPVRARKRTVFWFESPTPIAGAPLIVDPSGFWTRPEGHGWLAAVSPAPDPDVQPDDFEPDATDFETHVWPLLAARVPAFEAARVRRSWVGHYDWNAFDRNAFVGAVPGVEGLVFACGFSGHGLQQGPAVGRGLAELVLHGTYTSLDLAPLGVERLARNAPLVEANVI